MNPASFPWATSTARAPREQSIANRSVLGMWILAAAFVVFAACAANFLYFFVDDEGISLVYAQQLLRGHGIVYNSIEGRVEGYTNFLHVLVGTALLAGVKGLGWPKLTVFFLGKGLSLLAGFGTILLSFLTMRRLREVRDAGLAAGLAVLATAGPLAVWSSSSLDTVPFTFLLMLLVFALVSGEHAGTNSKRFDRLALAAAALVSLERLDGPIFVAVLVGAWFLFAGRARRAALALRVILPAFLLIGAYHVWRVWYFGDLLNMPAHTKLFYKLAEDANLRINAPPLAYGRGLVSLYGFPALAVLAAGTAYAVFISAAIWPLLVATIAILFYVAKVGDWMFGFRFFVSVFPLISVLIAQAISVVFRSRPKVAWAVAIAAAFWCGDRAIAFERTYERAERQVSWLRHPSLDPALYFGRYYEVLRRASAHIPRGARVAYNQSGFVPFMLDLDNIDPLGICSRFYAELPTRDVFFTEVGRYAPLSPRPIVQATEAYLLYHDVEFVIQGIKLLRGANSGRIPEQLMGGYYTLVDTIEGSEAIYRRTDRDGSEYKREPRLFTENLAHTANVLRASVDGHAVPYHTIPNRFDFLRQATGEIGFTSQYTFDIEFGDADLDVSELAISDAQASDPVSLILELQSANHAVAYATRLDVKAKLSERQQLLVRFPQIIRASRLHVTILGPPHPAHVQLYDVRVLGQTPALSAYIRKMLTFTDDDAAVGNRPER